MKTHRLFFALWPPDEVRRAMVNTCTRLPVQKKGRAVKPENLHITLHFAGSVTEEAMDCMLQAAQAISLPSFELKLDRLGYFKRARVMWMGSHDVPPEIQQLYNKLGAALAPCGYRQEQRAYAPHVTLKRKCTMPDIPDLDFSITWKVNEFVLVESITHQQGVEYQVVEKYALL